MEKEYNYHTFIMGCDFDMTFIASSIEQADKYFAKSFVIAQGFEKKFSRFDANSELSKLNRQKKMTVSMEFLKVWSIAYDLYQKTKGVFNPLVQVSAMGYNKTFKNLTKNNRVEENLTYNTNMDEVKVVNNKIILRKNQLLDFNGFLKGYVAQVIVESFSDIPGIIINIGGDIYVGKSLFEIEIVNPLRNKENIKIYLKNESLCTSGIYKRKWTVNGKSRHHILDIKTKKSAKEEIVSASVVSSSGSSADAYATMAVATGVEKAKNFFKKNKISCVLICADDAIIMTGRFIKFIPK